MHNDAQPPCEGGIPVWDNVICNLGWLETDLRLLF